MEFDVKRVYTAVNADELHEGDYIIGANTIGELKHRVDKFLEEVAPLSERSLERLSCVCDETTQHRFVDSSGYACMLAYLVMRKPEPKPEYIPWIYSNCPLKCGDVVHYRNEDTCVQGDYMVTGVDNTDYLIIGREKVSYSNLLEKYTFKGQKCGALANSLNAMTMETGK